MIFNFLLLKILSKRIMCNKKVFARPWYFDYEKSLALLICEKYFVKHLGLHLYLQVVYLFIK
jgi:hypothetical protein